MENNSMKRALFTGLSVAALGIAVSTVSIAQQPKIVDLSINNENITVETSSKKVSEVLEDIGYEFVEGSRTNLPLDTKVEDNMEIVIDTEKTINLENGGTPLSVKTFAANVEELLAEQNITVSEDDLVTPSMNTELESGDSVKVDYFEFKTWTKEVEIDFTSEKEYSFDLNVGDTKVAVEGQKGIKEEVYTKTLKNNQEVSEELTSEQVTKEPVNEKILIGSKKVVNEDIDFKTRNRNNRNMYVGETKVVQKGSKGNLQKVYEEKDGESNLVSEEVTKKPVDKIIENGTKKRPVVAKTSSKSNSSNNRSSSSSSSSNRSSSSSRSSSSTRRYSLRDLQFHGIINWNGYKYTYYSQRVLPGPGLRIPGRHVNANGFVADKDGYIVVANDRPKGTIVPTPFGAMGKVYDRGTYGNHIDIYTR